MNHGKTGPLAGTKVLEIAGIGPGPFCSMLLADLGADVVVVERVAGEAEPLFGEQSMINRGKRSLAVDLKTREGVDAVLQLVSEADALIEGMRPGVMERLGLGPEVCLSQNPKLVYGRMTGWGQSGPLAHAAGHDLNYVALSGALWYAGQPGHAPLAPPTLVGDIGGALYLAVGLLAGILHARNAGEGQVVDTAIVDCSAHMTTLLLALQASGKMHTERGTSWLDGPHWYGTYRCSDGAFITIASLEPKFYGELCERLGVANDPAFRDGYDPRVWPHLRERFVALFESRTRAEWCTLLEGTNACFAPVLTPEEAADHPHLIARGVYSLTKSPLQANPAPHFSVTPLSRRGASPRRGEHNETLRHGWHGGSPLVVDAGRSQA